jgi:hypothetical protein
MEIALFSAGASTSLKFAPQAVQAGCIVIDNSSAFRMDPAIPLVYRDFPDVFYPDFPQAAQAFAEPLRETAADPALIGYFLMNEPTWGFARETPAAGMLFNTPACFSRQALADFMQRKYQQDEALAAAWEVPATFSLLRKGAWD